MKGMPVNMKETCEKEEQSKYIRTDLAAECYPPAAADTDEEKKTEQDFDGLIYKVKESKGIKITELEVTSKSGEEKIGKPLGRYITAEIGRLWQKGKTEQEKTAEILAQILSSLISDSVKKSGIKTTVREDGSIDCGTVLIVGLGNRFVTADAIGPLAVDGITVTRHIKLSDKELFGKLGASETAAIAPGVAGQTGIETSELVKSTAKSISPSVIIAIDALAARSTERLGTTVQLCDTGISPGSGIGNFRGAINYKTLGIPVIAIGVPTIVDSSTLVYDALSQAGIENIPPELEKILENGRSFFVSLKESDEATKTLSKLIGDMIGIVFGTHFD